MEEKESPHTSSPGNSESGSPPQVTAGDGGFAVAVTAAPATGSADFPGKKKRGRPRKYDADGNLRIPPPYRVASPATGFSLSPCSPEFSSSKRARGRPPGSGNWRILASLGEAFANTAAGDFTPHVVTVNAGEDVAEKIVGFSQNGPRGVCVLSANGAVSNVTIRQPGSSGGILTYEGRFEILSLSGSYTITQTNGVRSRTGGLSVSLAGPDGRVIGGGLAGLLTAASPIQIVVGSFMPNGYKAHKRKLLREHGMLPSPVAAARPISQAQLDTGNGPMASSLPTPGLNGGDVNGGTIERQNLNFPNQNAAAWNGTEPSHIQRPSPDINVSVSCGE